MRLPTGCRNTYNTRDVKSRLHPQSLRNGKCKKTCTKLFISVREGTVLKEAVSEPSLMAKEAEVT